MTVPAGAVSVGISETWPSRRPTSLRVCVACAGSLPTMVGVWIGRLVVYHHAYPTRPAATSTPAMRPTQTQVFERFCGSSIGGRAQLRRLQARCRGFAPPPHRLPRPRQRRHSSAGGSSSSDCSIARSSPVEPGSGVAGSSGASAASSAAASARPKPPRRHPAHRAPRRIRARRPLRALGAAPGSSVASGCGGCLGLQEPRRPAAPPMRPRLANPASRRSSRPSPPAFHLPPILPERR